MPCDRRANGGDLTDRQLRISAPVIQTGSGTGAVTSIKVTRVTRRGNKWLHPVTSNMLPSLPIRVATPSQAFAGNAAHNGPGKVPDNPSCQKYVQKNRRLRQLRPEPRSSEASYRVDLPSLDIRSYQAALRFICLIT